MSTIGAGCGQADPCEAAAEHLQACGITGSLATETCSADRQLAAESLLDQSCDALRSGRLAGKEDGDADETCTPAQVTHCSGYCPAETELFSITLYLWSSSCAQVDRSSSAELQQANVDWERANVGWELGFRCSCSYAIIPRP